MSCHARLAAHAYLLRERVPPEPSALVALLAAGGLYARGFWRVWLRADAGRAQLRQRALLFVGGLLAVALALESPVDELSGSLFCVHMVQHLLLIAVAAPLLVLGAPLTPWLWALPPSARRGIRRLWRRLAWLELPVVALALHSAALWLWHIPALYDAALATRPIHVLEHLAFLGTAVLFWWSVLRVGASGSALGVVCVFALALQSTLLGALLTFSPAAWYSSHAATTAAFGLTPVEDQQFAGLIMWIPGGVIYLVAALWLFNAWIVFSGRAESRRQGHQRVR